MTTMIDLLLSRGSTKYKEQVQKLLESQPAVKKDRAFFFCISQTGSHFFGIFFAFPKPGVFFCIFLHFLDRVCHLHRLPDPYEKTTRK